MKKLTVISLFIFWAVVTSLLTAGLVFYKDAPGSISPSQIGTNIPKKILTVQEIAQHNNASDCWLLIDGKIYNITSYIYQHPGNANTIIPTCGTDATKAYSTKGRTTRPTPHSQDALALLKGYYIGDLGQLPATTANPPINTTTGATTQPTNAVVTLSTQEIATHNTIANCWMTMNGSVYDVTSYIPRHPGGAGAISPYCGKDGAAAFEGLPHSMNATQLLAGFLVGAIGQTATITPPQSATPTTPTQNFWGWEDDD